MMASELIGRAIDIVEQGGVDIVTGLGTFTADERDTILRALNAINTSDAVVSKLVREVAPMLPITTHDTPEYAEVYFGDGNRHSSQAMTMNPEHWNALNELFAALSQPLGSQENGNG